ncbi:bifunctional ADP-dependent NAD(P)H-hydrate dehydratase/NAD(P)H-hydrate epimerase [Halobacillus andaensis]|uniref:Bifunctional NAD(P)H-hydrate repair enzyme n=1 Tax=Halobacillus andaensis TaxID=1176239 RepID=A0A917BDD7_HALAA|nr:NAD(P)H-hydrate dehydratase [Halobacillus andaensis]MBP2006196.1 NAD(P)H-hydrate epimerase [Halobacillus andaensis]GGF33199.1 bifunctional ADP-dependent NAD(P)H-hydrate dehydratase/NAD(P)H-hydrate epimerase [Halobacillus andaensis]
MEIVTAQEMYERDQVAIQTVGVSGVMLMENAGRAICDDVAKKITTDQRIAVLIGGGNNGGDGFVIARTLRTRGFQVEAWQVVSDEKITGDAHAHKEMYMNSGFYLHHMEDLTSFQKALQQADVIIDAILGIGVRGPLRPPLDQVVSILNDLPAYTISVDIPSGVPADEGAEDFERVQADYTCIIEAPKMSAFLQSTSPYYGEWNVVEIGLPNHLMDQANREVWNVQEALRSFPVRAPHSHKGSHGKGVVIGGSYHMPGSIAMTAKAALRSGIGLLAIATSKSSIPMIAPYLQEATFQSLQEEDGWIRNLKNVDWSAFDGVAIGMGIRRSTSLTAQMDELFTHANGPMIIDADGIYHIKEKLDKCAGYPHPVILTPHPGEFAYLTDCSIAEVMQFPFSMTRNFAKANGVYVVLKGPSTIITTPEGQQRVETSGNEGLAKGGSGDVLSGILLALTLQSSSVFDALANGCLVHGKTAERLTKTTHSTFDLLATDLIDGLSETFRTFSSST